ncbi:hypothetical protein J9T75_004134 [Salmonella enterica]|nr:hypothetical protein [Salmonella enterica]HED0202375.1 hypothetical protein [Salmonella enterica subsp. enterica serovar Orientalis]
MKNSLQKNTLNSLPQKNGNIDSSFLYSNNCDSSFYPEIHGGAKYYRGSLMTEQKKSSFVAKNSVKGMTESNHQDDVIFTGIPFSEVNDSQCYDAESISIGGFTEDTLISTAVGPFHLGELYHLNKEPEVITRDGTILKSDGVDSGGMHEVFGLLTNTSYIKGSGSHRVLRINPDCTSEMVELKDLRKGDFVVYQKGIFGSDFPVYNDEKLDVCDAQELGKHISNMSRHNPQMSVYYSSDKFYNKTGYFSINIYNTLNKFNNFVYRVPEKLLRAPEEFISAYLRGYFDGGTRFHLNRISATAVCREFASDIVYLLSLFGINGEIAKTLTGFEVVIHNKPDINIFIKRIGFLNNHDFSGSHCKPVVSGVDYKKLIDEYNQKTSDLSCRNMALPETITELLECLNLYKESFILLGLENKFKTLALLSQRGCRVTEVTEYAKYTGRDEVFGVINVAENHTWCANGIIVSDCELI